MHVIKTTAQGLVPAARQTPTAAPLQANFLSESEQNDHQAGGLRFQNGKQVFEFCSDTYSWWFKPQL